MQTRPMRTPFTPDFIAVAAGTCGVLETQVFPTSVIIIQPAANLPTDYHEFKINHDSI
jgi:hypothetical protein